MTNCLECKYCHMKNNYSFYCNKGCYKDLPLDIIRLNNTPCMFYKERLD